MRILAIAGAPGCGKTTLMLRLMERLACGYRITNRHGLLDYTMMGRTAVLGKYTPGEKFGGTDKLAMNVQADAEDFLRYVTGASGLLFDAIVFEGDRLCAGKYLSACARCGELRFIVLQLDAALLQERRRARSDEVGKEQNQTWLRGRESKVKSLTSTFAAEVRMVNTEEQVATLVEELRAWLLWETTVEIRRPPAAATLF